MRGYSAASAWFKGTYVHTEASCHSAVIARVLAVCGLFSAVQSEHSMYHVQQAEHQSRTIGRERRRAASTHLRSEQSRGAVFARVLAMGLQFLRGLETCTSRAQTHTNAQTHTRTNTHHTHTHTQHPTPNTITRGSGHRMPCESHPVAGLRVGWASEWVGPSRNGSTMPQHPHRRTHTRTHTRQRPQHTHAP